MLQSKVYILSTINIWKKLLSTAILHHVSQHHQSSQQRQRRQFIPSHAHCSKNTNFNQILLILLQWKLYISNTKNFWKKLLSTAIWADKIVSQHHQSRQRRQWRPFIPSHAHCAKNANCNQILLFFFVTVKGIHPKY